MSHRLYRTGLGARDIYPELKKYFYKENSDVNNEEFLSTKFGLWIDTRSSIDNTFHGNGRAVNKGMVLQIEKIAGASGCDRNAMFLALKMQQPTLHLGGPDGILTMEK